MTVQINQVIALVLVLSLIQRMVSCYVAWPLNESEAVGEKSKEVSIKARSPNASLSFKGQATKHTAIKW